jgi:hypothetical protein
MNVEAEIAKCRADIAAAEQRIEWFSKHREAIEATPEQGYFYAAGNSIDFDRMSHPEIVQVIRALGGKWKKDISTGEAGRIDYTATIDGVNIRCYAGEPPPNCKIVDVLEEVPEVPAVPATVRTVKKLVCK